METTLSKQDQQTLMDGATLKYTSADHDLEAWYESEQDRGFGYKIWFNGTFVHVSKTYQSFEKKLDQMITKYHLTRVGCMDEDGSEYHRAILFGRCVDCGEEVE